MKTENKAEYTLAVVLGIIRLKESETRQGTKPDIDDIRRVIINDEKKFPQVSCSVHQYFYAGKPIELATRMLYRAYNLHLKAQEYERKISTKTYPAI